MEVTEQRRPVATRDFAIGLAAVLAGVLLLLVVIPAQVRVPAASQDEVSPALLPQILAGLLVALGLAQTAGAWTGVRAGGRLADLAPAWMPLARALAAMAVAAAWAALMPVLGFTLATGLGIAALVMHLGRPAPLRAALVGALSAAVLAEMFVRVLRVPLPRGALFE